MRKLTDLTKVINIYINEWEDKLKKIPNVKNKKIEICIVDDLKFNASVGFNPKFKDEDRFQIKINEGVFHQIWNFYHRTFNVSNPDLIKMASFMDEDFVYDDNFAMHLANLYINVTINFVFLHELGHIVNNHLAYIKSLKYEEELMMDYPEPNNIAGLNISAYEYQTLEMEADEFATKNILEIITSEYLVKQLFKQPSIYHVAPTLKHLCLYIFSAIVNERSLQGIGANRRNYDLANARYLPSRMRLLVILQELVKNINTIIIDDGYPEELIMQHIEGFESTINKYLVEECLYDESVLSSQNNLNELDTEVLNHVKHLKETIYPNLKKKLESLL
ncbi:hypothetical protein [Bacillus cereus]|uniref:hypothetical protein n=1 Tax=Bacillus cereus TaxID=1396 RepID=UPI001F2223B1|nr:hypothetical protein [Bacillus cereus]BCC29293.1 hypothetical protein BCM0100_2019 [Bacillus cereus]